jgi:hypothetical protein
MAAALCSPGGGAGGRLRSERRVRWVLSSRAAGARNVRVVMCPRAGRVCHWPYPDMRASAWRQGFGGDGRQHTAGIGRAGQAGARAATAGPGAPGRGISALAAIAPTRRRRGRTATASCGGRHRRDPWQSTGPGPAGTIRPPAPGVRAGRAAAVLARDFAVTGPRRLSFAGGGRPLHPGSAHGPLGRAPGQERSRAGHRGAHEAAGEDVPDDAGERGQGEQPPEVFPFDYSRATRR